jgi:hypothetical protein
VGEMVSKEEIEIVIERLKTMPAGLKMSIGSKGTYNKWDLMKEVQDNSEVGQLVVNVYMQNLRSFKD